MPPQILFILIFRLFLQTGCTNCLIWAKSDKVVSSINTLSPGQRTGYIVMNETEAAKKEGMHIAIRMAQSSKSEAIITVYFNVCIQRTLSYVDKYCVDLSSILLLIFIGHLQRWLECTLQWWMNSISACSIQKGSNSMHGEGRETMVMGSCPVIRQF